MDALDWGLTWISALAVVGVSGWFAPTGIAARMQRSPRAWGRYAFDVAIIATVAVLVHFLATEGKGCSRSARCVCDNNDTACIEQYCR